MSNDISVTTYISYYQVLQIFNIKKALKVSLTILIITDNKDESLQ